MTVPRPDAEENPGTARYAFTVQSAVSSVSVEQGQSTIMSAKQKPAKTSGSSTGLYKADSVKVGRLLFFSQDSF
jgi:hypothetical protein